MRRSLPSHLTHPVKSWPTNIILYLLEGEFWYFTHDLSAEEGHIRSISEGDMFVPQEGWQYTSCSTVR